MLTEFIGFAEDCRITGWIEIADGQRLSDHLNAEPVLTIWQAALVAHADGRTVEVEEMTLEQSELYAVVATGRRGNRSQRITTERQRVEIRLGPYLVLGQVHTLPGGQPIIAVGRSRPMMALTRATIAYSAGGEVQAMDMDALVVNRDRAEWVRADPAELVLFDGVATRVPATSV